MKFLRIYEAFATQVGDCVWSHSSHKLLVRSHSCCGCVLLAVLPVCCTTLWCIVLQTVVLQTVPRTARPAGGGNARGGGAQVADRVLCG